MAKKNQLETYVQRGFIDICVSGEDIQCDLTQELTIVEVSSEMNKIAAQIDWWGAILAAARAEAEQLDAMYRQWRALRVIEILEDERTLAEWKVNAKINALKGFMKHKNAKASAIRNVARLELTVKAFLVKADSLRSKGANQRAFIDSEGMNTKSERPRKSKKDRNIERDNRTERVRRKIQAAKT